MRRSLAPFSGAESLGHTQSLADFITTTSGFRFSVHTTINDTTEMEVDAFTTWFGVIILRAMIWIVHDV